MKIVIDITDEQYEIIKELVKNQNRVCPEADSAEKIITNGTPLPKNHGDLVDREELLKAIDTWDKFGVDDTNSLFRLDNLSLPHYVPYIHYDDMVKSVSGAETIIEAESEEE